MGSGLLGALAALMVACRPRQWPKNLLVFAAPLFAFRFETDVWLRAGGALAAFCLISSAIYLLNDCLDVQADRAHPSKRHRPIAAGLVSVPTSLATGVVLAAASLSLATLITPALAGVILLYGLIQVGYCFQLKRMPLLDLFCIASGFLLRAIAGVVAGGFGFSPWFLLTVGLLALFLAIEKRKAELRVAQDLGVITRKVLERYSLPLLLRLEPGRDQRLYELQPLGCRPCAQWCLHHVDAAHRALRFGGNLPLSTPERFRGSRTPTSVGP